MLQRMVFGLLALTMIAACEPTAKEPPPRAETGQRIRGEIDTFTIDPAFFERGAQALQAQLDSSLALRLAAQRFLDKNDETHWQQLRDQWIASHNQWHNSQFYLASSQQYPSSLPALTRAARNVHSTPITPGFIDGIPGYPKSGIVFDITVPITAKDLRSQHQSYSKEEVSIGLHAMEFLLWGKQLSDYSEARSITQEEVFRGIKQEQLPTPRRRAYLLLLTELIVEDSRQLVADWADSTQRLNRLRPNQKRKLISGNAIQQLSLLVNRPEYNHAEYSQDLSWQSALLSGTEQGVANPALSLKTAMELHAQLQASTDTVERSALQAQLTQLLAKAIVSLQSLPAPETTTTPVTSE